MVGAATRVFNPVAAVAGGEPWTIISVIGAFLVPQRDHSATTHLLMAVFATALVARCKAGKAVSCKHLLSCYRTRMLNANTALVLERTPS